MSVLLSVQNLTKSFGARPLFEEITFVIEDGERIGLIGPNGAGKSTLLRLLAGLDTADSGSLSGQKGLVTGYLEQVPHFPEGATVEQILFESAASSRGSGEALAGELMSRLELGPIASNRVDTLSGGWSKRVALARELVKGPDLLLLDEPTNHLDLESILWLEQFLSRSPFATITVTHDRAFLQKISTRILELDKRNPKGLLSVKGDYALYVERKQELMDQQERQEKVLRNTLRRETEWLRQGAKARTTKQQARIHAAEALQGRVEELEERNVNRTARIDFQSSDKKPKRLIEAQKISKTRGDRVLFKDVDVFLGPGSRVGLLGHNGCGKSTLIRVLLGEEPSDTGKILVSEHLKAVHFEQNRETLEPTSTVRQTLCRSGDHVIYRGNSVHIHGYLDRFLFQKDQVDLPVGRLSGGEQSRLLLARLMLRPANLLILDEPTNDLDVETLDVLQDCLTGFDGGVLLVTHDRYFLDQVATEILAFPKAGDESGKIVSFAGLAQWEDFYREKKTIKAPPPKGNRESTPLKKKLGYNETRELAEMEGNIEKVENRLAELQKESEKPENQSNSTILAEVYSSMDAAQKEIERLYKRWAELDALSSK